jgi:glycosyltransferase involved in cell wall biosynthesis
VKLIVQIPCLNEEQTLPSVLETIPRQIPGIDEIEILVIDDGCTDRTVEVAREHGVTQFVHHSRNQGLGRSFRDGVVRALELGADILVNTDGDNQYPQERIADLVRPIVERRADVVIADRETHLIEHFSPTKKLLQRVGSAVVNRAAGTALPDAASGFRAYSRESLMVLNTITRFSYCMETTIQAGNKRLKIASIPITTNAKSRESRLFRSTSEHVAKSAAAIVRSYMMYKPYVLFAWITAVFGVLGLIPFVRYGVLWMKDREDGHLQSLLVGALLLILAFMSLMLGVISDLIRTNRILIEDNLEHTKRIRYGVPHPGRDHLHAPSVVSSDRTAVP